jgi:hypothetical protein
MSSDRTLRRRLVLKLVLRGVLRVAIVLGWISVPRRSFWTARRSGHRMCWWYSIGPASSYHALETRRQVASVGLSAWENMRRRRSGWESGEGVGVMAEDRRVD